MALDRPELSSRLDRCALAIARFLVGQQSAGGHFPARDFYGRAFSALLWSRYGTEFAQPMGRAIDSIAAEQARPLPDNYHFEFIRFALIKLFAGRPDLGELKHVLTRERYHGTRVANWTLLRAFCRCHSTSSFERAKGRAEIAAARQWFSHRTGLIEDRKGEYTTQYHAFSAALLGELIAGPMKDSASTRRWFELSVDALADLVLPGGQCNYIGRGSLQSFGYSAAVLAFAHACRNFGRSRYREEAEQVLGFIERHQAANGSLPLVLRETPEGRPETFDLKSPDHAGWWSYNNYYDYLPFTGVMLRLAAEIFGSCRCDETSVPPSVDTRRLGASIVKVKRPWYTAVFTLPNHRLRAASLPVPYMEMAGSYPFPCYGGEQEKDSIYSERGLPLPIVVLENGQHIVFSRFRYRWTGPFSFSGYGEGFSHLRELAFAAEQIVVRDTVGWRAGARVRDTRMLRILLPRPRAAVNSGDTVVVDGLTLKFSGPVHEEGEQHYSANGPLACFYVAPDVAAGANTVRAQVVIGITTPALL